MRKSVTVTLDFDFGDEVIVVKKDSKNNGKTGVVNKVIMTPGHKIVYDAGIYDESIGDTMPYSAKYLRLANR